MGWIAGITITCFAASYAVALALEASRLLFRSGVRGALMIGFAAAGLFAQTLFLGYRAFTSEAAPLSSAFDWYLLAAWALAAIYLYLTYYHPKAPIGLFVLPLVLALIAAAQFADRQPFAQTPAGQVWGALHGGFHLLGLLAVAVGFVAGMMYLVQARWLKLKRPPRPGFRLPSLEWLEGVNARAITISAVMVGLGFVSGIILNLVLRGRQADELPWTDPVVWRSAALFGWLVAAALFNALYRPTRRGRKVAYLTIATGLFLAISLGIRLVVPTEHGSGPGRAAADGELLEADL